MADDDCSDIRENKVTVWNPGAREEALEVHCYNACFVFEFDGSRLILRAEPAGALYAWLRDRFTQGAP